MVIWLQRQFENVERTVSRWSAGKRQAAGIPITDEERSLLPQCFDCGLPYEEFGGDLVLPHAEWAKITPVDGDGLLCATCMMRRLGSTVYGSTDYTWSQRAMEARNYDSSP